MMMTVALISAGEELYQHWSEDVGFHHVRLTFKSAGRRVGKDVRERLHPVAHPRWALSTVHNQRGHGDGGPSLGRQWLASLVVLHNSDVVRECVRDGRQL